MDIIAIAQKLETLRERLDGMGLYGVDVEIAVWTGGQTAIRLELHYRPDDQAGTHYEEFARRMTWDELNELDDTEAMISGWLSDAAAWIDDIPSEEVRQHNAFTAAVGRLIDQGREVGIDVDFLNPLTAMMEKLASNALEDKRNH